MSRHRRRKLRSPAATDLALRGARPWLSSRPTVAGIIARNVQMTADSDMIGAVPVRTRGVFTHRDDFLMPACAERGLVRTAMFHALADVPRAGRLR